MVDLKVGSKVRITKDTEGFTKGQVVEVFRLGLNGMHLFKGVNTKYQYCDGKSGAWVFPWNYKAITETEATAHQHANLMLKYAQIAQYDAKPWEHFECSDDGTDWNQCTCNDFFYMSKKYRLKPQTPVVQVWQTWVNLNSGKKVKVLRKPYPSEGGCGEVEKWVIGVVLDESINLVSSVVISELDLINHFKLKE